MMESKGQSAKELSEILKMAFSKTFILGRTGQSSCSERLGDVNEEEEDDDKRTNSTGNEEWDYEGVSDGYVECT